MKLIFIYGLPGVGKMTVANELAKLTGYKLFHIHLLADMLASVFDFGEQGFVDLFQVVWPMMIRRAAEDEVEGLITTFVFTRPPDAAMVLDAVSAVESSGGKSMFVELRCNQDELEKRLVNPSRLQYRKLTSVPILNQLLRRGDLTIPDLPEAGLSINNTELSPLEVAQQIVASDSATS